MGYIDEKYLTELKSQIEALEKKFNLEVKHNATFNELKSILTSIRNIKNEIQKIEKNLN